MSQSVLTFLPALHGDAFIIHFYKGDNDGYPKIRNYHPIHD